MQNFEGDPTIKSKFMAILIRYASLADHTSSSMSRDSIATLRKTTFRNSCKNLSVIQWWDQKLLSFWPVTEIRRPDLHVTELWYHNNPKENGFRKLVQKLERDPTAGSKVMAILTRYASLAN
jgi:hypothetical protein